jgi:Serine/threonine protein kinase
MSKFLDEIISKGILAKFGYKLIEKLGEGAFGVVYKCEKDEQIYAMKIVASDDENVVKKEIDASLRSRKFRFDKLEECADFFHSSSRGVFIGKGESGSRTQSIPRGGISPSKETREENRFDD